MVPVNYFSPDELQTLISIIQDQHGLKLTRQQFTDISFDLFEDISGLEGVDPEKAMEIINTLWSVYCEYKPWNSTDSIPYQSNFVHGCHQDRSRNFNVHSLKIGLMVYDECRANQQLPKDEKLPMWAIGQKLKLIQSALPEKDDTKYETTNKRNVMTVAVSRYMSQTSRMVENTSLGRFPDSTSVN